VLDVWVRMAEACRQRDETAILRRRTESLRRRAVQVYSRTEAIALSQLKGASTTGAGAFIKAYLNNRV
jgi:hypothetical protein